MKVAVVGSGISGLAAAYHLRHHAQVTLFESGSYAGGHTHTVDITLPTPEGERTWGVDTGFLVYNERTYPGLIALFEELEIATAPSDMSFSVQVPNVPLEWSGSNLFTVFAQKRNLVNPRFMGMLAQLLRFNRLCTHLSQQDNQEEWDESLESFLDRHGFGQAFRDWYLLPMLGCIWSCPTDQMLRFPVSTMLRFCHNHGLLQIANRPQWFTVVGGARHYVEKILTRIPEVRLDCPVLQVERKDQGVMLVTAQGSEHFDHVVLATHSDQALDLLHSPTTQEREVLGAIRYQPNHAVLHTDSSVLPVRRSAWAAWNYERATQSGQESTRVCLHYWLNRLQPMPFEQPVIESLNPIRPIASTHVLGEYWYSHPVFDLAATRAQKRVPELQGVGNLWFCGAWTGYGFHEDGLKSGRAVAQALIQHTSGASL